MKGFVVITDNGTFIKMAGNSISETSDLEEASFFEIDDEDSYKAICERFASAIRFPAVMTVRLLTIK